jgi:hypothetical protein
MQVADDSHFSPQWVRVRWRQMIKCTNSKLATDRSITIEINRTQQNYSGSLVLASHELARTRLSRYVNSRKTHHTL